MSLSAILLAAGYATRLYPLTQDRPKALLSLGEGVILDAVVEAVRSVPSVERCILVTNHRFVEQFRAWQHARHAAITILDDGTSEVNARLGAIRDLELGRVQGGAAGDVLVVGTDNLFRWSLQEFVTRAQRHRPHPSIALWEAPSKAEATQFGVVEIDHEHRIISFEEKPAEPSSALVALCVYYFPQQMCDQIQRFLDEGSTADAPGYFIRWLVRQNNVYGVTMPGVWYDIGTLETYRTVVAAWPAK